jgi:hypothetical protein
VASAQLEMTDVKRVVRELGTIDRELQKEFRAQAAEIAKPAIRAVQDAYRQVPLSGMAGKWSDRGRLIFPFEVGRAQRGVRFRLDYRRNAIGVMNIEQRDPAAAVFETAGRATGNPLERSLNQVAMSRYWQVVPQVPTRVMGKAVFSAARQGITDAFRRLILDAARTVERRI